MSVQWYANIGDDSTPNWIDIQQSDSIHLTGAGSLPDNTKPIFRPASGYVWNEEIWIGAPIIVGGQKVLNWVKPSAVTQSGLVFKAEFSEAVNAAPVLSAFDNEDFDSWDYEILRGTEATEWNSLLKAFITGKESAFTAPSQGWAVMETGKAGNMNPNALAGNTSFVTIPFIPAAGDDVTFTMAFAVPYDADSGKDGKYDPKVGIAFVHV